MNTSLTSLNKMSIDQLDHFFSLSTAPHYRDIDSQKTYSSFEIAEMTHLLFCAQLPQIELETILITLAHIEGTPIPMILKTFYKMQKTNFKYFAECAYQESCIWNDIECAGVEYINIHEDLE